MTVSERALTALRQIGREGAVVDGGSVCSVARCLSGNKVYTYDKLGGA